MLLFYINSVTSDSGREFITLLYHKLNKRLLGYSYHLSHDVEWARDATQEVFLTAIGKILTLTQMTDDEAAAYCFTIVKNNYLQWVKQNGREESIDIQEIEIADTDNDQTEDIILKQFEYAEIKSAVKQLSERHRIMITLRFGLNRTHAEIAKELGTSISYSQNLQAAAICQLRQILGVK